MSQDSVLVTPNAVEHPISLPQSQYDELVQKTNQGWSSCSSIEEFFAKYHYLKEGFRQGKLDQAGFLEREKRLLLTWWKQGAR